MSDASQEADGRLVYIARAVDRRRVEEREQAARTLSQKVKAAGFRPVDPVARPFPGFDQRNILSDYDRVLSDLAWLRRCDVLIADMSIPDWPYIGCICELVYARLYDVPAIVITGENLVGDRIWLRFHADAVVHDIDEAVNVLRSLPRGARANRVA
jgi:hypothetical protein